MERTVALFGHSNRYSFKDTPLDFIHDTAIQLGCARHALDLVAN
jgi:hypothetical protein